MAKNDKRNELLEYTTELLKDVKDRVISPEKAMEDFCSKFNGISFTVPCRPHDDKWYIKAALSDGLTVPEIAKKYNITTPYIYKVRATLTKKPA